MEEVEWQGRGLLEVASASLAETSVLHWGAKPLAGGARPAGNNRCNDLSAS